MSGIGFPFGAAGSGHSAGLVPDPGGTLHSPPYVLAESGVWVPANGINSVIDGTHSVSPVNTLSCFVLLSGEGIGTSQVAPGVAAIGVGSRPSKRQFGLYQLQGSATAQYVPFMPHGNPGTDQYGDITIEATLTKNNSAVAANLCVLVLDTVTNAFQNYQIVGTGTGNGVATYSTVSGVTFSAVPIGWVPANSIAVVRIEADPVLKSWHFRVVAEDIEQIPVLWNTIWLDISFGGSSTLPIITPSFVWSDGDSFTGLSRVFVNYVQVFPK